MQYLFAVIPHESSVVRLAATAEHEAMEGFCRGIVHGIVEYIAPRPEFHFCSFLGTQMTQTLAVTATPNFARWIELRFHPNICNIV